MLLTGIRLQQDFQPHFKKQIQLKTRLMILQRKNYKPFVWLSTIFCFLFIFCIPKIYSQSKPIVSLDSFTHNYFKTAILKFHVSGLFETEENLSLSTEFRFAKNRYAGLGFGTIIKSPRESIFDKHFLEEYTRFNDSVLNYTVRAEYRQYLPQYLRRISDIKKKGVFYFSYQGIYNSINFNKWVFYCKEWNPDSTCKSKDSSYYHIPIKQLSIQALFGKEKIIKKHLTAEYFVGFGVRLFSRTSPESDLIKTIPLNPYDTRDGRRNLFGNLTIPKDGITVRPTLNAGFRFGYAF